jgi:2-hydroxycyclohexanecarboxyl-CoA dehydrogenase
MSGGVARLAGQRAVVTGGGRGIGAGIARRLAAEGAHVTVADIDLAPALEVAGEIGGTAVELDVADPEAVRAALGGERTFEVLVNNAGYDQFCWFT